MMRRNHLLTLAACCLLSLFCLAPHGTTAESNQSKPTEVKIDPRKFDELVGQYAFVESPDFVLSFFRENDKFFVQATDQGRIEIFPASETQFFVKSFDADATFTRDPSGKVTGLVW